MQSTSAETIELLKAPDTRKTIYDIDISCLPPTLRSSTRPSSMMILSKKDGKAWPRIYLWDRRNWPGSWTRERLLGCSAIFMRPAGFWGLLWGVTILRGAMQFLNGGYKEVRDRWDRGSKILLVLFITLDHRCNLRVLQVENDTNYEFLLGYLSLIHHPVNKLDIQACWIGLRGGLGCRFLRMYIMCDHNDRPLWRLWLTARTYAERMHRSSKWKFLASNKWSISHIVHVISWMS